MATPEITVRCQNGIHSWLPTANRNPAPLPATPTKWLARNPILIHRSPGIRRPLAGNRHARSRRIILPSMALIFLQQVYPLGPQGQGDFGARLQPITLGHMQQHRHDDGRPAWPIPSEAELRHVMTAMTMSLIDSRSAPSVLLAPPRNAKRSMALRFLTCELSAG